MSANLVLESETEPVLWRGPVVANAIKQFYSETIWGDIDYLLVDMSAAADGIRTAEAVVGALGRTR